MTSSGRVWSTAEKITEAVRLKDEGNAYVKQGEIKKALKSYKSVFLYVNGLIAQDNHAMARYAGGDVLSQEDADAVKELKVNTHSNLALCYTKLNLPEKVVDQCERALVINPKHVKSLIRLGATQLALGQLDKAKRNLLAAYELDPKNEGVQRELKLLKLALAEQAVQQKEKDRATFGGKLL